MINLEEKDDIRPICPHCKMDLHSISYQQIRSFLGKRYVYYCSGCRSVLGVTHRKGLLMG